MAHRIVITSEKNMTIELVRGDSFIQYLSFTKNDDEYIPEEGDTATFTMRKNYKGLSKDDILIQKVIDLSKTTRLELVPEDTENLEYGSYKFDIEFNYADGKRDTVLIGVFKLLKEVT